MPETQVAENASSVSPAIPAGGDGALNLSDEDILGINPGDAAATETAAEPEAAPALEAPVTPEVLPEEVDDLKWMRPLLNDKAFGPRLQSMHDRLLAFQELYPKVADARAIRELLPEGAEGLKNLIAKSKEVDEMDLQYFSRDPEEQKSFANNLFRDDPEAFQGMMQIGLELIRAQSPQEWGYLTNHLVGQTLDGEKVWDWLEYIHEQAAAIPGTEPIVRLLNQFAGTFQRYGLGPKTNEQDPNLIRVREAQGQFETEKAAWQRERQKEFNADTDKNVTGSLDTDIGAQLTKLLPKTSEGLRSKIARDVHSEIQKSVSGDAGLKLRLSNLMRQGGINRQTQEQVTNLLVSKARLILPGAVKRVVAEYTASIMARNSEVTGKQNAAASRPDVSSGARPGTGVRPLTRDDAKEMSDLDILNDTRPVRLK
jgi:hypothetical protein